MIIIMRTDATQNEIEEVTQKVESYGAKAHLSKGRERTIIGIVGDVHQVNKDEFMLMPYVDRVVPISRPYKLASREFSAQNTIVPLNGIRFGAKEVVIIAGPCAVESRTQMLEIAHAVKEAGATALRGGAYKPRTSPYSFQGLGQEGLEILAEAREATGLAVVTEVLSADQIPLVAKYADMLQIGSRNMKNTALLHAAGESRHPVLLKRGMSATTDEFLLAAEYILSHNNQKVVLCERGIRTFETATRYTTDINAIPVLKRQTHLPVILDPSHSTGHWQYVSAVARSGIAAGADGLIVEVHNKPEEALSDGSQSLKPERFAEMVAEVSAIAKAVGRSLCTKSIHE
ncbi:MAG: 3-deoxy-7-phosphoheptulonate synthase [Chloroflexota bacterium]|nr:3-deoxy-7-phosphoheptulonate synthase [Chloroflexota bacterium]